mmetsp:Transcript_4367/g.13199  ORF Transcript_4367/g.13199 Transcript_4367/m.13199 type:complete len:151 (+) Transcript_4367:151-603(+)
MGRTGHAHELCRLCARPGAHLSRYLRRGAHFSLARDHSLLLILLLPHRLLRFHKVLRRGSRGLRPRSSKHAECNGATQGLKLPYILDMLEEVRCLLSDSSMHQLLLHEGADAAPLVLGEVHRPVEYVLRLISFQHGVAQAADEMEVHALL